jgi:methylenetetrahydrofolate dehydrogenase (NADP+)/methenyltetrahydrofolate cyclohydrolase
MEQMILDGKALSKLVEEELEARVRDIKVKLGFAPVLATILVGNDPSSEVYVNMKGNACRRVGLEPRKIAMPQDSSTEQVLAGDR